MKPAKLAFILIALLGMPILAAWWFSPPTQKERFGPVVYETRSDYSQIRLRSRDTLRSLFFVREDGRESCQSSVDLANPGRLELAYSRGIFLSFLLKHPQDRVLIIGLGGGGMVRFLNHHFPPMVVEAVEIDPVVVQLAKSHFGVKDGPHCKLHTADAFEFVPSGTDAFDCIYFDAFLRAPEDWGVQEKALRLKTKEFLSQVRDRVSPGGVVAFNIIPTDPGAQQDIETIREVFPATLRFAIPHSGNEVLLCLLDGPRPAQADLEARAIDLDKKLSLGFSFAELLKQRLE